MNKVQIKRFMLNYVSIIMLKNTKKLLFEHIQHQ